jgi:hypothetical protein
MDFDDRLWFNLPDRKNHFVPILANSAIPKKMQRQ